jgi:hypothetical protein
MRLQLFEIGEFAAMVGNVLSEPFDMVRTVVENPFYHRLRIDKNADGYLVISEHPSVDLCRFIENATWNTQKPFLPVIIDHPYMTVGPLVNKSAGICYHCYNERLMQHHPSPGLASAVNRYYETHIGEGPKGFHTLDVSMVANWIAYTFKENIDLFTGKLWRLNLITRECVTSLPVAIHGCPRCGGHIDENSRSYAKLWDSLFESEERSDRYENIK